MNGFRPPDRRRTYRDKRRTGNKTPLQQACKSPETRLQLHFSRAADAFREGDSIEVRRGFYGLKNTRLLKRAGGNTCGRRSSERAVFGNLTCNQEPAAASVQSGGGRHLVRHKKYARKLRGTIFTVSLKRLMAGYCTPDYGLALNRLPDICCAHTLCDEKAKGITRGKAAFHISFTAPSNIEIFVLQQQAGAATAHCAKRQSRLLNGKRKLPHRSSSSALN